MTEFWKSGHEFTLFVKDRVSESDFLTEDQGAQEAKWGLDFEFLSLD